MLFQYKEKAISSVNIQKIPPVQNLTKNNSIKTQKLNFLKVGACLANKTLFSLRLKRKKLHLTYLLKEVTTCKFSVLF